MIRPLGPGDFDELLELEARASPKSQYDLWELKSLYWRYPNTFLVSVSEQIDGYIVFGPDGHIVSMAVRPERRRRGIGTKLINESIAYCSGKSLHLEVRMGNLGAQEFYQHLGFEKRAEVSSYYDDGEDAVLMERPASEHDETSES